MMAGGLHGGGGADHFSNYAHVQDPHAAWYRWIGQPDRRLRPAQYLQRWRGYGGGYYGHPWAAGAAGVAAGAAIGAGIANRNDYYDNGIFPYAAIRPTRPAIERDITDTTLCRGVPMAGARTWTRVAVAVPGGTVTMHRLSLMLATACLVAAPAFAQEEVTCGDYSLMDNAKQMETIAALEVADQRDGEGEPAHRRRHPREAGGRVQGQGRRPRDRRHQGRLILTYPGPGRYGSRHAVRAFRERRV